MGQKTFFPEHFSLRTNLQNNEAETGWSHYLERLLDVARPVLLHVACKKCKPCLGPSGLRNLSSAAFCLSLPLSAPAATSGDNICACPLCSHEVPFGLLCFSLSRGAVGILEVTAQRRHFKFAVICNPDADCTYLREDDEHIDTSGPPWLRLFAGLLRLR